MFAQNTGGTREQIKINFQYNNNIKIKSLPGVILPIRGSAFLYRPKLIQLIN